ncbi:MAG: membrane protein insertase YidC [candidate division Zixibacteria bacterium]|nr:membrane protein insertase YidC [candidate division Zixibacteria bacterium]
MDRKTILAFALIALIFILMPFYNKLFFPAQDKSETTIEDRPAVGEAQMRADEPPEQTDTAAVVEDEKPVKEEEPDSVIFEDTRPRRFVKVETDLYEAVFSTKGASLVSFVLKKYEKSGGGKIDMASLGRRGVLLLKNQDAYLPSERMNYAVSDTALRLSVRDKEGKITFTWQDKSGVKIEKAYTFDNDKYSIVLDVDVEGAEALDIDKGYYLSWDSPLPLTETNAGEDLDPMGGYAMFGGENLDFKDVDVGEEMHQEKSGTTAWVAQKSKYFTAAIIPDSRMGSGFYVNGTAREETFNEEKIERKYFDVGVYMESSGAEKYADEFIVYIGPIDYYLLSEYEVELEALVSMGWKIIQPFSVAVLWVFTQLHHIIPNYGIVIVLFSILIKIVLFPLSRKSMTSMAKMQDIQPKIKEIQEKYKSDRNKLSQETMKLYKEHGVNPFGSCLPLILQMPLFYALFVVFRSTIELRGASFMLWITDLSQMDPYYVLPIVMGATMFIQQKLTIKDPKQKMMVYLMPALFTFLFYSMPAGLVLYWTMYNILSLIEQLYIRRNLASSGSTAVKE